MSGRVIIFSTNYFPNVGGAEIAVREITNRIASNQLSFTLIAPRLSRELKAEEMIGTVKVFRVGLGFSIDKWILPFFAFLKAQSLHKKNSFDKAWSIMASQASIGASWFKMKNPKVKLILTLQEGDEEQHLLRYTFGNRTLYNIFVKPFHTLVFKKADIVTVISSYLKERAKENGVTVPIHIVPNGADVDLFDSEYSDEELVALENSLGKKDGDFFIVTTSRLVKKNAVGDTIQSLVYLPISVKFIVIGEGGEYNSLRSLAEVYGVAARVKFLGFIKQEDLPKYLKISDVFVRPSLSEGFGNSFVEAMASGIPVVATPVGGIVDFLKDNETGLFCNVSHPRSIAEKVQLVRDNHSLMARIVKNAKNLVNEKYTWNAVAKEMREIFNG